jgi:hypothetical protein
MVAYGVLELKQKEPDLKSLFSVNGSSQEHKENFERDQLRKLVSDELKRYGLLLQREVVPKNTGWRTRQNRHILYGQLQGPRGFNTRSVLCTGDYRTCCQHAAQILDELDKSQIPDTATGND